MQRQLYPDKVLIPFGTRVHVKKKVYGVGGKYDLESRWDVGQYLGPSRDVNEGSVIMMTKGNFITTKNLRLGLIDIDMDKEVELEDYHALVATPERRLRRKATLKPADYEGLPALPQPDAEEEGAPPVVYDPTDPVEEYARAVLNEGRIERDFVESLANLLPEDGTKPQRFGDKTEDEVVWSSGAFVHGGVAGILNNTKKYPRATKVFLDYLKQHCPGVKCNSIAVFKGTQAEPHRDAHNVGENVVVPLSEFEGCDIVVKERGQEIKLTVSEGPQRFNPPSEHYTTPCTKGTSWMLVGYSVRDSAKLKVHKQLMQFQRIRERIHLKAAKPSEGGDATVDYERLLEELEGDLDAIHTVPLEQVRRVLQRWTQAIEKEVASLFNSGTLVKISYKRARQMEQNGELKIVPAKCVFTLKPPADAGGKCRRKCRMVICGNFINKDDVDGQMRGHGSRLSRMSPIFAGRDSGDYDDSLWMVQRPLYGLRESPVIWSQFRNAKLREIRVVVRGRRLALKQLVTESELWLLIEEGNEEHGHVYGILVVYVDDLTYLGDESTIAAMHKEIAALWPTSALELVGSSRAIRYLGVEIKQDPNNKAFSINQQAYIADLLRAHDMQNVAHTLLPTPREWLEALETEEGGEPSFTEEDLKLGQRLVGEALWLATKTRPDILYVVNAMASHVARKPLQVARIGKRLLTYLAGTSDLTLVLRAPAEGEQKTMTCFTDASFAPFGARSHGATVITYGQAPEIEPNAFDRILAIDNSSAVSMRSGGPGSQRTRHLKVRASYIREAVKNGRLRVCHTPGEQQLADLATKLLTKERLWQLLELWGFIGGRLTKMFEAAKMKVIAIMMMLISLVSPVDGADSEEEGSSIQVSGWDELLAVSGLLAYKGARKNVKLNQIRRVAAEAAKREVEEVTRGRAEEASTRRSPSPTGFVAQSEGREPTFRTLTRRRHVTEHVPRTPSPTPVRFEETPLGSTSDQERMRVIHDMLDLMTVERLREALRYLGMPVSGIKQDLIQRLSPQLGHVEPGVGSDQPTVRQMKFVLYLWRKKDLQGRVMLTWADIATRRDISAWISRYKERN
eukprot:s6959_g5.t1